MSSNDKSAIIEKILQYGKCLYTLHLIELSLFLLLLLSLIVRIDVIGTWPPLSALVIIVDASFSNSGFFGNIVEVIISSLILIIATLIYHIYYIYYFRRMSKIIKKDRLLSAKPTSFYLIVSVITFLSAPFILVNRVFNIVNTVEESTFFDYKVLTAIAPSFLFLLLLSVGIYIVFKHYKSHLYSIVSKALFISSTFAISYIIVNILEISIVDIMLDESSSYLIETVPFLFILYLLTSTYLVYKLNRCIKEFNLTIQSKAAASCHLDQDASEVENAHFKN